MLSSRRETRPRRQPRTHRNARLIPPLLAQAHALQAQAPLRVLSTQKPTRGYRVSWLQGPFKHISQMGKLRLQLALTQLQRLTLC